MISLARSCGLQPDCYPLTIIAINSKKRSLRLFSKSAELESSIDLLTSGDPVGTSGQLRDGCLGHRCCGVRLSVDAKEVPNPSLFAILCPSSEGKRAELLVFPYNFPQLLPLLQQAKEVCSRIGGPGNLSMVANTPTSLPPSWQTQMGTYLRSVPTYYYPCLYKTFKSLGLHVFFSLLIGSATSSPPPPDISLSRPCMRQLAQVAQKAKADLCLIDPSETLGDNTVSLTSPARPPTVSLVDGHQVDSSLLEYNITNHRGPIYLQRALHWKNPSSLIAVGISSSANYRNFHSQQQSPAVSSVHHPAIPHLGGQPPAPHDLLYTWEKIRGTIYGGSGVTVRGLYVAGLHGSSSGSHLRRDAQHDTDWFFKACGGSTVPRLSIACMSDYVSILSRKEALRDPEILSPPQDEDQTQGILKRKLAVNFGSPYKARKQRSASPILVSDEPALPSAYEYRDGVTVTDDIFNLPSPDSDQHPEDSHSNEAFVAFSTPSSPLILLDQTTGASDDKTSSSGSSLSPSSEIKSIPKLKLKGRKTYRPPASAPLTSKSTPSLLSSIGGGDKGSPVQGGVASETFSSAGHTKNISGIALTSNPLSPNSPASALLPASPQQDPIHSSATSHDVPSLASEPTPHVLPPTAPLPAGWIKRFSEKHKCEYWFNTVTGVSQWTPPAQDSVVSV